MVNTVGNIPMPINEPVKGYAPGSPEALQLKSTLDDLGSQELEIPAIIGGKEVRTGDMGVCVEPHNHKHVIARYHKVGAKQVEEAVQVALKAQKEWERLPWQQRANVFLKAAELLAGKYRYVINAATMLNQSKNPFQAEIDSACELIDFWRFNPYFMQEMFKTQPPYSPTPTLNSLEHRPLEGFIFAVTPFNFTSIAGNLPTSPAMLGNVVLWKPASTAVYSGYWLMKILMEAGVPEGVINFIPGSGSQVGNPVMSSPHLAGIHFTGSTPVFQRMWKDIGNNIANYRTYPRIVGETGGKDFAMIHPSADVDAVVTAALRGAWEFQGQKCSALSRMYVPKSMYKEFSEKLFAELDTFKIGPVQDFSNFMNAVIDKAAFDNTVDYIEHARKSKDAEIAYGGTYDDSEGYFINPTVILAKDPHYRSMEEEIFAPVLSVYVYEDNKFEETLEICDQTSIYALTGSIFSQDRYAINLAIEKLRNAAGNFYVNDKPTGAVVGQQPFGGARGSGTNDKAGSMLNLQRWTSQRTIKETFLPPTNYRYPFMG